MPKLAVSDRSSRRMLLWRLAPPFRRNFVRAGRQETRTQVSRMPGESCATFARATNRPAFSAPPRPLTAVRAEPLCLSGSGATEPGNLGRDQPEPGYGLQLRLRLLPGGSADSAAGHRCR